MVNGLCYFGLSLAADDLGGGLYLNFILSSLVEFPSILFTIVACDRLGRKATSVYPTIVAGVACIIVAFIPSSGGIKYLRIFVGIFGKFCINAGFSAIYTWTVELHPTKIRANGMGLVQVFARIGAASSPWVAKGLKKVHHTVPFIAMGAITVAAGVLMFWLPETKGQVEDKQEKGVAMKDIAGQENTMYESKE